MEEVSKSGIIDDNLPVAILVRGKGFCNVPYYLQRIYWSGWGQRSTGSFHHSGLNLALWLDHVLLISLGSGQDEHYGCRHWLPMSNWASTRASPGRLSNGPATSSVPANSISGEWDFFHR